MLASELSGRVVYASGMNKIGSVEDEMIDPDGFRLTDLVVKLDKDSARRIFGERVMFGGLKIRVPVDAIDKIGDGITLKFGLDTLQEHVHKIQ